MIVVDTNVIGYLLLSSKDQLFGCALFCTSSVYGLVHLRKDPNIIAIFISNHLKIFGTQESCSKFSWQLHEDRRLAQVLIQMMLVIV
jgi:hypothetical protein